MAASSPSCNLLLLLLIASLGGLVTPGSAFLSDWRRWTSSAPLEPHFTGCVSRDQATFRCWWSPGAYHNLSSPGALRVFYLKRASVNSTEWKECPHYIHSNRECFFDAKYTSIWVTYCMQLRSQNVTFYNDEDCFTVEKIVRPDPPVSLNWTLLNMSPSGVTYDVMVNWEPPPSADVAVGWMRVEYEIQYREMNATNWEALEMQPHNKQTIFGLLIENEYEVHIRCRMLGFSKFGEFSDSIFIQVDEVPGSVLFPETTYPLAIVIGVVFGIVGALVLIMLIVVSQQHRFMMFLLPPVPAPKIKGIDSDMLKNGKLDELNLILSGGGMGGLSTYAPDFYQDEPWVEFIEVDAEDADAGEKEDHQGSDTQRLLGLPQPARHGCSNTISFPDDDSGRASCYDPDLLDQDALIPMAVLWPDLAEDPEASFGDVEAQASEKKEVAQNTGPQTWVNTDFYAQVSNVTPSGGVVLSPGQQLRSRDGASATQKEEAQKKGKSSEGGDGTEEKKQKEPQFELLIVDPDASAYVTESNAQQSSTPTISPIPCEGQQTLQPQLVETKPAAEDNQSPYIVSDSPLTQFSAPVSDYTVVQEVDTQHSLLLNPPSRHSPAPCVPQHPLKSLPAMPVGYVTPDLLGNLSP